LFYDIIDLVKLGQAAEIVATVRSDTPSRKGCMATVHRFGGFYRDIELEATPTTRLDDVWVRGGLDKKAALVNVSIRREGEPNIQLGWWSLGDQIGTAFARHPVFGDFPHDGRLSPLWFRLIKRGLPLAIDPKFGEIEHFAVGEGQKQYFSYVCQKKGPNGQPLLMTRGVDLLADTPEGICLLDAMVDFARGDSLVGRGVTVEP